MKRDSLAQRIKMIEQHLQTLQRRAGALPEQQTLAAEILEELSATLKELSAAAEELSQHNDELELRVKERAAELAESNQALQNEVEELAARDQAILTSLIEGLVIFDLEGNVLSMNPVALHIHGFSQVEEAQKHLSEYPATFTLHYLDGRPMPVEEWPVTRVLRGETFSSLEVQVWHMDTGRAWIASYGGAPVCDKNGNMILGVLTLRNITAQKEAELQREQLLARVEQEWQRAEKLALEAQQRAAELDATIAAIADGVVIYEPTGEIARMNPAAEKILGYSPAERELPLDAQVLLARIESMDGQPFADIKDTPDQRVLRGEAACNAVMAVRDIQSSQRIWVSARAAPIQAPDGRLLGVVASYTDITELRRARDELELRVQERTVELTKANEALQQYALRLSILREIDRAILAAQSPSEIALTALGYVCKLVPCQRASVILFDFEAGEAILLAATANGSHRAGPDQRIRLDAVIGIAELRQGHPFVVEDIQALTERSSASELLLAQTTHSYVSVPLISRSQLIGSLNLEATSPGTLDVGHLEIANELVGPLAVVIQDARLYEAERQARQTAEALREATAALASTLDLQQILDDTLAYLERVIPYDSACVFLHEGISLRVAAVRGHPHWQEVIGSEYRVEDDLLYQEIRSSGSPVILADAQADPRFKRWDGADDVRGWMGVPLIARGKIVGMLTLDCRQVAGFIQAEATLAQAFANQAAVAIENARLFEQVRTGREQLRLLARQVVSVQEQERRRVSRELHDEAGQALTALKISLELVMADLPSGAESLHERIRESVILTDDTMERIRLLARDLRPPALDAVGLSPTLEDVCRDFGERTHLSINYEGEKLPVLPDAVSICLYRVLQEALTNVAKHAQAQHVWAALRRETDSISLSVEDDGQGFDTQATLSFTGRPMGIGLLGIQDRLELLSGWLEIDSQPGKGTRLVAHVPWEETE